MEHDNQQTSSEVVGKVHEEMPIIGASRSGQQSVRHGLSNLNINFIQFSLADGPLRMIRGGLLGSQSLKSIRLGNNIINPEEALFLIQAFDAKPRGNPFELLDLENVFVNKECVPVSFLHFQNPSHIFINFR